MGLIVPVNPKTVVAALRERAGVELSLAEVDLQWRDWRWMAQLPGERILFVPDDARALRRLEAERAMLVKIGGKLSFETPRPLASGDDAAIDLRARVEGLDGRIARPHDLDAFAQDFGRLAAELHGALRVPEVRGLALDPDPWPPSADALREKLPKSGVHPSLVDDMLEVVERHEMLINELEEDELVLVHGDLGAHNFAFDEESHRLSGVFDFDHTTLGDRHQDLKWLPSYGERFMERALQSYARVCQFEPRRDRILLHHAAGAIGYLAWRVDDPVAHDTFSGRDFAAGVAWVERAVESVLSVPIP